MMFAPFNDNAIATRFDGVINATITVSDEAHLVLVSAEIHGDGQFLTLVFKEVEK